MSKSNIFSSIIPYYRNSPTQIAVLFESKSLTYQQLLYQALHHSHHIQSQYHIQPNDIIIQILDRSIEMIIGMLSILLCQAVYCPIHPNDPNERILSLLELYQPKVIITSSQFSNYNLYNLVYDQSLSFDQTQLSSFEQTLHQIEHLQMDECCLLHTSGSTGIPKGVMLTHSNLQYATNISNHSLRILQLSSCSFFAHI
jgi:acyl-CoA synthetase (AMP-forming)/AMP-acid ligase II